MTTLVKCNGCNGTGRLAHYAHLDNGICYACAGTGKARATAESDRSAYDEAYVVLDSMRNRGLLTEVQMDANWDWCVAKRAAGMPGTEILERVRASEAKHKAR